MNPFNIRPATDADLPFMWEMLFESAFTTDEQRSAWRRDPQRPPELRKYLDRWGRPGDAGVIAEDPEERRLGAAWYRLFGEGDRGDGIIAAANVPELAIAVEPEYRGRGVGGALLAALAQRARDGGYGCLILSVDPANDPALRLYDRTGFTQFDTEDQARGTSRIMQLTF